MSDTVRFENYRFGEVEVREADLLHFPGLPGFPDARRFVVMEHDCDSPFAWLVCVDDPDLAFAIANPWDFFPDYRPPLGLQQLRAVGVEAPDDLEILVIANVGRDAISLNLAAPLLCNPRTRQAMQAILEKSPYSAREPLPELRTAD